MKLLIFLMLCIFSWQLSDIYDVLVEIKDKLKEK